MNWEEMEQTPRRYGVWMNKKTGKLALARPHTDANYDFEIDKGLVKKHPLFRIKQGVIAQGTGNFFFNKHLRGYELIDEGEFKDEVVRLSPETDDIESFHNE